MINKQLEKLFGVNEKNYIDYCKKNNLPCYNNECKREFFKKVISGRIIENANGEFINKGD